MKGTPKFSNLTPPAKQVGVGCWYDGSHLSSHMLNLRIAELALAYGAEWDLVEDPVVWAEVQRQLEMPKVSHVTEPYDVWLSELANEAEAWLNEHVAQEEHGFFIDDNSLFYGKIEEEEGV